MSYSEQEADEVDSESLSGLDSEAEVQGSVYATQDMCKEGSVYATQDMNLPTETVDPDEEEKEVNNSQNELCQADVLNPPHEKVAHVQKVTEALRIPVRKSQVTEPLRILFSKKLATRQEFESLPT